MSNPLDVDDICAVCGTKRDEHGDKNHQFNLDGQLIPIKPGPLPSNTPPQLKDDVVKSLTHDQTTKAFLRLIETLQKKNILTFEDMPFILGGFDANSTGT